MKYCYSLKINDQNFLLVLNFCLFHSKSLEVFSTLTRIQADRIWPQRQCCNRTGCPKNCNIFTPNTKKVRLCSSNKSHSLKRSSRIKRRRPFEGTMKNAKRSICSSFSHPRMRCIDVASNSRTRTRLSPFVSHSEDSHHLQRRFGARKAAESHSKRWCKRSKFLTSKLEKIQMELTQLEKLFDLWWEKYCVGISMTLEKNPKEALSGIPWILNIDQRKNRRCL